MDKTVETLYQISTFSRYHSYGMGGGVENIS